MDEPSFMRALFHGVVAEELIFPYPAMASDERDSVAVMVESVRRFLHDKVDPSAIDASGTIDEAVLAEAKALGLFGLEVPTELGGIGLSSTAYNRILQEVAGWDASLAVVLGAHQSIGYKALELFGTAEQQRRFLPELAAGRRVAAFALTEPSAGSDAASIKTYAEPSADGAYYSLNGSKIWVTNGELADLFTVFARTTRETEGQKPKITAFLVERGDGVTVGSNEDKLGIRGTSTAALYLDDVRVPASHVIGERGHGFKVAMTVLNAGRLGLAAGCVGSCRMLCNLAIARVQERRAFGRPIGQFGIIKDKIARMLACTYALESATYLTTGLVDAKTPDFSLESAICKVMGSETLWWVVNEALQIAAGIGYMREYPYERRLRDARINLIFEGTNEVLRCFIALAGMAGPGDRLAEVAQAIREPIKGFGLLRNFALRKARTMIVPERMTRVHPALSREAVLFEECTSQLGRHVENVLRKHGEEIAEMQFVQRRVADVAIDLYALAACLSRTSQAIESRGEDAAGRQIDHTRTFAAQAGARLRQNIAEFEANDDELRKASAERAYADNRYALDVI